MADDEKTKAKITGFIDLSGNNSQYDRKRIPERQSSGSSANPEIYMGNTFVVKGKVDERRDGSRTTYSMVYGDGRLFFGDYKPQQGEKGTITRVTKIGLFADAKFTSRSIDSRVEPNARQDLKKEKTPEKKIIPEKIEKLEDIPFGVHEKWDAAKRYAIGFETKFKNKSWGTWTEANNDLIAAREYFSKFRESNTKGTMLETFMDEKYFALLQVMAGSYDREKAASGTRASPVNIPTPTAVKRPPKATGSQTGRVVLDYNPDSFYYVLAYGNNSNLNPLVIKADKGLYQGNANQLAKKIESLSETDIPEKQRASYRSLINVIENFKQPADSGKSRRYLVTFNNEGAKEKNTDFHGNWRVLDENDWSESNKQKIKTWIYDNNTPAPGKEINVLKVQLTQEIYGGLERSLL